MASKKQTETGSAPLVVKKRYLSAAQCKATAARISMEMRTYPADLNNWQKYGIAPVVPLWGPDFDAVEAKVLRLYHADETALILETITL